MIHFVASCVLKIHTIVVPHPPPLRCRLCSSSPIQKYTPLATEAVEARFALLRGDEDETPFLCTHYTFRSHAAVCERFFFLRPAALAMFLSKPTRAGAKDARADGHVQARRLQEDRLSAAEVMAAEDNVLRQYADWEVRTQSKIENRNLMTRIDGMQARRDETVERRRQRLAAILAEENERYEKELENTSETQDQRRDRIAHLALALRAERETIRGEFAQSQKERAFRAKCPEVLEAASKASLLRVVADRERQLTWNNERQESEAEQDTYHDAIWEEERLKKQARHEADRRRQQEIKESLQRNLRTQKAAAQRSRTEREEEERLEGEAFRTQLEQGAAEDAAAERRRREQQHALGRQNKMYNVELEKIKEAERHRELEVDKEFLGELLAKVREDEDAERTAKRQAREASVAHMRDVEKQMMSAAGAETELDRLWLMESNREWDKKEARWQSEQARRDKLLRNTYEGRSKQVVDARDRKAAQKDNKAAERDEMIKEIERLQTEEKAQLAARYEQAQNYQKCLKAQDRDKKV